MPTLHHISPLFIVDNIHQAVSFYVDKLKFQLQFIGPEGDEFFAIVGRDRVAIMLKEITPEIKPIPNNTRHEWARWDAYVYVDDPDALFNEFTSAGVTFFSSLRDNEDGLRGFDIKDGDGYVLYFGRPIRKD